MGLSNRIWKEPRRSRPDPYVPRPPIPYAVFELSIDNRSDEWLFYGGFYIRRDRFSSYNRLGRSRQPDGVKLRSKVFLDVEAIENLSTRSELIPSAPYFGCRGNETGHSLKTYTGGYTAQCPEPLN